MSRFSLHRLRHLKTPDIVVPGELAHIPEKESASGSPAPSHRWKWIKKAASTQNFTSETQLRSSTGAKPPSDRGLPNGFLSIEYGENNVLYRHKHHPHLIRSLSKRTGNDFNQGTHKVATEPPVLDLSDLEDLPDVLPSPRGIPRPSYYSLTRPSPRYRLEVSYFPEISMILETQESSGHPSQEPISAQLSQPSVLDENTLPNNGVGENQSDNMDAENLHDENTSSIDCRGDSSCKPSAIGIDPRELRHLGKIPSSCRVLRKQSENLLSRTPSPGNFAHLIQCDDASLIPAPLHVVSQNEKTKKLRKQVSRNIPPRIPRRRHNRYSSLDGMIQRAASSAVLPLQQTISAPPEEAIETTSWKTPICLYAEIRLPERVPSHKLKKKEKRHSLHKLVDQSQYEETFHTSRLSVASTLVAEEPASSSVHEIRLADLVDTSRTPIAQVPRRVNAADIVRRNMIREQVWATVACGTQLELSKELFEELKRPRQDEIEIGEARY